MLRKRGTQSMAFVLSMVLVVSMLVVAPIAMAEGTVLNFALSTEPAHLKVFNNGGQSGRAICLNIYRGLFSYRNSRITNELCESYSVEDDNRTYTFVLRDAKFHNGDPVTAQDVKFTLEYIQDPANGATYRSEISNIESITAVDEKTVRLVTKEPCAPLLHYLSMPEASILSEKWVSEHPNLTEAPMGAGPYRFVSWEKGQYCRVERFEDYYRPGYPLTDEIYFWFYADDDARVNALKSEEVDIVEFTPWKYLAELENDPAYVSVTEYGACMSMVFNPAYEPLANPLVRQAICYAIDREKCINTAFSGRGKEATGAPVTETFSGYDPALEGTYVYNPEKAKELLAQAGYPDGFDLTILSTSTYSMHELPAISIQDDLKSIGINVTLDLPDWATRLTKGAASDYQAAIVGMSFDYADPDCLMTYFYGAAVSNNHPQAFVDEELDNLFDKGRAILDPEERAAVYKELYARLLEVAPSVFYMWRDQSYTMLESVENFVNLSGALTIYSPICLEEVVVNR